MKKRYIVLDANALMMPFQYDLNVDAQLSDLFGEGYILAISNSILKELEGLATHDRNAKMALSLAKKCEVFDAEAKGDDSILEIVTELDPVAVVTNDKELSGRLKEIGTKVVAMKKGSRLAMI